MPLNHIGLAGGSCALPLTIAACFLAATSQKSNPMNPPTIHLAFNIDHAYVTHCSVTLLSIVKNTPNNLVVAHILSRGLTDEDKLLMKRLMQQYGGEIYFYEPNEKLLEGFKIHASSTHISLVTYYRCMLADYLPKNLQRVIYLDSDIIVTGSLEPFWNLPLHGAPLAAVTDAAAGDASRYEVLHYPASEGYFNAGVLLIDLEWWRKNHVGKRCTDYYRQYPERIRFNDQDLLNSIFHGQVCWASIVYNAQEGFYRTRYDRFSQHKAELANPIVVHFTNRKPWNWDCLHPMSQLYFDYWKLLPQELRETDVRKNLLWQLAKGMKRLPYALHLRKARYWRV